MARAYLEQLRASHGEPPPAAAQAPGGLELGAAKPGQLVACAAALPLLKLPMFIS